MASLDINDKACLLFYDPKRLWQIQAQAQLIKQSTDPKNIQNYQNLHKRTIPQE